MVKYVTFDPSVINDDGVIRLYYGTWFPFHEYGKLLDGNFYKTESNMFGKSVSEIKAYKDGIMGANHVVLADDMLTVKTEPCHILPNRVKGTPFEKHPFFEGSSIRKIGETYYFVYSSSLGHELCYATSQYPDRDFVYGGTIVSNGDVGYLGRKGKDRLNATGTNHGSIECVGGQWYVFYHRNTHKSGYSRQGCAEPIEISADGSISQVEITTQGLNGKPLKAAGTFPAAICCNLTNGKMPHQGNGFIKKDIPYITCINHERIVIATNHTTIGYKYFDFRNVQAITVTIRGTGKGVLEVATEPEGSVCGKISVQPSEDWRSSDITASIPDGVHALYFRFRGSGKVEFLQFSFSN